MLRGLWAFWRKAHRDWIFNLASLLAYDLILASFPIVLVLLAVAILILNNLSPGVYAQLLLTLEAVLHPREEEAEQRQTGAPGVC
jgi:uncharacterized BrkB/YihY/UPF0761 family membrane protein